MKTITIGFSKPKGRLFPLGSYLIRAYQQTPYSHVYLKFHSESLSRTLIYEAIGGGVRFIGAKIWESHAVEVASFDVSISPESYVRLLQFCVDNAGEDYGLMQNLGVPLSNIFNLKVNPFQTGKNCSEVVSDILKLEGYKFDKESNLITPKDIHRVLSK